MIIILLLGACKSTKKYYGEPYITISMVEESQNNITSFNSFEIFKNYAKETNNYIINDTFISANMYHNYYYFHTKNDEIILSEEFCVYDETLGDVKN